MGWLGDFAVVCGDDLADHRYKSPRLLPAWSEAARGLGRSARVTPARGTGRPGQDEPAATCRGKRRARRPCRRPAIRGRGEPAGCVPPASRTPVGAASPAGDSQPECLTRPAPGEHTQPAGVVEIGELCED